MKHKLSQLFRRGQVTVEFALVLPLLFLVICATIDLSWIFFQYHSIHTTARQAARRGAIGAKDPELGTLVKNNCPNFGLTDANIDLIEVDSNGNRQGTTPNANQTGGTRVVGNQIRVTIRHNIMFLTFISSVLKGAGLTQLSVSSQFIIEDSSPNT